MSCILRQFEDVLDFKNHQTCVKEAALLGYFVEGFWWAKETNFNSQQISFIMALLQQLLDNIQSKWRSLKSSLNLLNMVAALGLLYFDNPSVWESGVNLLKSIY